MHRTDSTLTEEEHHSIYLGTCSTLWFDLLGEGFMLVACMLQQDDEPKHLKALTQTTEDQRRLDWPVLQCHLTPTPFNICEGTHAKHPVKLCEHCQILLGHHDNMSMTV